MLVPSVAVGDFNGDGKQDLALGHQLVRQRIGLAGRVRANSARPPTSASAVPLYSVAVGDFNGDGKQDLAVVNPGSNSV